jgi:hypothetical protein
MHVSVCSSEHIASALLSTLQTSLSMCFHCINSYFLYMWSLLFGASLVLQLYHAKDCANKEEFYEK